MVKRALLILLFLIPAFYIKAQPFIDEIKDFKTRDSLQFPPKNAILFVGSSSFRKWTDVQNYFPQYTIINRGFGGSTLTDVIRYENDIIFPYHPKQIVIYCGENDIASSEKITAQIVFERFKILFRDIRNKFPKIPVGFVSLKPSISRQSLMPKMEEANKLIQDFLKKQKNTAFINVYPAMLKPDGTPMDDIFIEDNLHMNAKGYAIWQKIIAPYLLKE